MTSLASLRLNPVWNFVSTSWQLNREAPNHPHSHKPVSDLNKPANPVQFEKDGITKVQILADLSKYTYTHACIHIHI